MRGGRRALVRSLPSLAGPTTTEPHAVSLAEACAQLGISHRTGRKLVAQGRFPVPALPSLGIRRWRCSSVHLEQYLRQVHPLER